MILPRIDQQQMDDPENGEWMDMLFAVTDLVSDGDMRSVQIEAGIKGRIGGLKLNCPAFWPQGLNHVNEENPVLEQGFIRDGVFLCSIGQKTDTLLDWMQGWTGEDVKVKRNKSSILSRLFSQAPSPTELTLMGFHLGEEDIVLQDNFAHIKLFHDSVEPYWEAFLNLDIGNGVCSLNEKDPDYRRVMVACMSQVLGS